MTSSKTPKKGDTINLLGESEYRRSHGNLVKLFCVLTATGFILCLGLFGLWYSRPSVIYFFRHVLEDRSPTCSGIPNVEKFDCFPDGPVTEEKCLSRGCCYQAVSSNVPLGTPYCYYPSDFAGYYVQSISQNLRQMTIKLKRNFPSGFPKDISFLSVVITFIDDNTVRVKITDANSTRFEVPIHINEDLKDLKTPLYTVTVDSKNNLIVSRKSTGTAIFNVSLSRLVYSDQFLQISSRLPSPYLYGIGESYGPMLRSMNWTKITLFNSDQEPIPNHPLYGSQPFYLALEANGNANGVFLFNSNAMDVILQPTPAITFRPIGGILDFFILLGPSPSNVVQQYTSIVGRTFMPPYWSLGFHLCRYGYNSLNKTRETMENNINAGIPIDVQWNDIDYMNRYKDFTYDEVNFSGLPEFVDSLHTNGMHYVIMTDPGLSNSEKPGTYPPYDEGVKDDIFMKNPNGSIFVGKVWNDGNTVFPDFSHPNSTAYWLRQFTNFYRKVKFDGVWIDMNEPSNFVNGGIDGCEESPLEDPPYLPGAGVKLRTKTACMTARHFKTVHYNEHNLLGYREAAATYQSLKTIRNKRPFIISRATFAGQGVYSGHWSGDIASTWEDMRYTIPSTINFNIYGVSMIGSDICGFNRNTTVELCARWQALGAFYPFSRNHNERVTIAQDPAALGPTVVAATKNALSLRYLLLPYLYTLFYRSHVFGDTVVRPTFFEFPDDKNTYGQDEQFLWGPAVMIIPALYPNVSSVTTYLPKGVWYQGPPAMQIVSPGQRYSFPSDITSIAISVRGGYIIPTQLDSQTTTKSRKNNFVLTVTLDQSSEAHGELYWDDGDSLDSYENGKYNLIQFSAIKGVLNNTIIKSGYDGEMKLSNVGISGVNPLPREVTFNGIQCLRRLDTFEMFTAESSLMKSPLYSSSYNHNLTAGETCAFTVFPPVGLAIGFIPTSLLTPFKITWK